jgi:DNA-binding HxlR family transcriptional regulator
VARIPKSRRPIMRVLDILGRRWALRALWELRDGPRTFRALRQACDDVSPSSLNQRLAELRALGVVALGKAGYGLTPTGIELSRILLALSRWSDAALGPSRPALSRAAALRAGAHGTSPKSRRVQAAAPGGPRGQSRRQTQRRGRPAAVRKAAKNPTKQRSRRHRA